MKRSASSAARREPTFSATAAAMNSAPGVIVLQELFGVNADIREKCDEFAEQGFIAVAPDLFWRQEPGIDLGVRSEADWQHGLRLYQAYNRDEGVKDIKDTIKTVAKMSECTGRVAVLGYCLGALMTFLTAVRHRVDAAVAYHGGDTEKYLGEVDGLHAPLLLHLAEEDEFMSKPPKPRSRRRSPEIRMRRFTVTQANVTPSRDTMGNTTTPGPQVSPTDERANF